MHFTELQVWRRSHQLFLDVVNDLTQAADSRVLRILSDQVVRSTASVSANIAEGFNRSKKKYLSSLDISVGEAAETENWLYKLRDTGVITADTARLRIRECIAIQKMLHGLIKSISKRRDGREK
jgi:four helix bundle protein